MRIANPNPSHCSACYGQYPERKHIDFEAAYDGPVLDGSIKTSIDDLIVCVDCLKAAAKEIGFVKEDEIRDELERLSAKVDSQREMLAKADRVIADQEQAIRSRAILRTASKV